MNNANEILMEEPKLFSSTEEDVFSKINDNLREQKRLPNHKDMMSVRAALFAELRKLLDANARLHDKLKGPTLMTSKLREFVNQSLKQYDNGTVDSIPKVQSKSLLERFTLITEPSHCQSLRLTGNSHNKIVRLVYTNSGVALLALASNAVHLLWKWHHSEQNPSEKATARGRPQLWQPASGNSMSNNVMDTDVEGAVHCFAMTLDDKYVVSASGGMISVFSMVNFKASEIFESPPPAATYFAFYPGDNNIIAIGMEDSTIKIYNVKTNELVRTLKGHTKKITGLAFSNMQDVILVSSDANAKICVWTTKNWKRIKIMKLTLPSAWRCSVNRHSDTIVEFRRDQFHILVVHKTQIAIYKAIELKCVI